MIGTAWSQLTGLYWPLPLGPLRKQRLGQPRLRVEIGAVIGDGAFPAQGTAADRVVRIAQNLDAAILGFDDGDAAGVVAIARAGGLDDGFLGRDRHIVEGQGSIVNGTRVARLDFAGLHNLIL